MQLLRLTLDTPAENLALDEALIEWAEADSSMGDVLRLWESPEPIVVVGRSSRVAEEVRLAECRRRGVPVLRRASGGAAIVAGRGCLMYAVVLSFERHPQVALVDQAHDYVMARMAEGLATLLPGVQRAGISDLAIAAPGEGLAPKKFSGNSLRMKRNHCLYHGTLLYDFDLPLVQACLKSPPRQPDYRGARPHGEFITNLGVEPAALVDAVIAAWGADRVLDDWPQQDVARLVAERYGQSAWNHSR